jgi:hypothetical protein
MAGIFRVSVQRLMARVGPEIAGVALPRELFFARDAVRPSASLTTRKAKPKNPTQLEGAELFMNSAIARQIYGTEAKPLPLDFWAGGDRFPSSASREAELLRAGSW